MTADNGQILEYTTETVSVDRLTDHPRNYREHPDDQLDHIQASIEKHGFYRNVVVAEDYVILAGHGVVKACRRMGLSEVPIKRLEIKSDSPQALQILAGDNEIAGRGIIDDRALTEILKEITEFDIDDGLMGTGFDGDMLAGLAFVTRDASELGTIDEASHWVGLPEYEMEQVPEKLIILFKTKEDLARFAILAQLDITEKTISVWWPPRQKDDRSSVLLDG